MRARRPTAAPGPLTGQRKNGATNRDHGEKKDHSGFFSGFPENMGTFPEPGPPVVVVGCVVCTRGQGDRSPAPAWARGPGRAENDRAMGFAGMARSYRKIERFRDILGHGSHHHPPVPAEMAATCGRSGPCPRNHPTKRFRSVRRHGPPPPKNPALSACSRAGPAPTEKSSVFGIFWAMGCALTPRSRRNARHLR